MDKVNIQHFTDVPEIQHFAMEKVSANDNVYGVTWGNVVKEYLRKGYELLVKESVVESFGKTYRVLDRGDVTAFYDKDGNTLFDVENARLEREYQMIKAEEESDAEPKTDMGKVISSIEKAAFDSVPDEEPAVEMGTASLVDIVKGIPASTEEEVEAAEKEKEMPQIEKAVQKLEKERADAKNKDFADPIIGYLIKRCEEDPGMVEDVLQEHKTWKKCFEYVSKEAKKQVSGNCAAVRDSVVYEWAEDYYRKDDKAEEEKKAKEVAERIKKAREDAKNKKKSGKAEKKTVKKQETPKTNENQQPKEQEKHKPKGNVMDGQMDLFSMMGM